jgi:AraC-like DNA-binding protein
VESDAVMRATAVHNHARGQLLGTLSGLATVGTGVGKWVVPPTTAVWIPPRRDHDFHSHGTFRCWSVYVAERLCARFPVEPQVLQVSDLLREAVARTARWSGHANAPTQRRLCAVILDEILLLPPMPFELPMPSDLRLVRIASAIIERPEERCGMEEWAGYGGISPRTLTRLFPAQTGFTFTAWRQRALILKAMELLAKGSSVTCTAFDLGYETVSGFIDVFKANVGVTPANYLRAEKGG